MTPEAPKEFSSLTDEALFQEMASGQTGAFSVIYDRYSPQLYGLALKILQNQSLAEDVIQDIFVNIWKKAGAYDRSRGTPIAWMTILCRNRCIDMLRRQDKNRRRSAILDEDVLQVIADERAENPLENASFSEMRGVIKRAMENLPEEQRQAIEMAYFKGFSQSEIAGELNLPLGTVKTRMRLGMQKLKDLITKKWDQ
jgi:RNA polymerase sigma-70 factor (ECF subfamily)